MMRGWSPLLARPKTSGAVFLTLVVLFGTFAFGRHAVFTELAPGNTITAVFARDYRLRDYLSEVKIAGVVVGAVVDVAPSGGHSLVSMKLDKGVTAKLGDTPSATIRPATLLGGKYYVELTPGGPPGEFSGAIPLQRTRIAVELDGVLETLQPRARAGIQQAVAQLDATLSRDGTPALQQLLHDTPRALAPAGQAIDAFTGQQPDSLNNMVTGLEKTADVLISQRGQLDGILSNLNTTADVLEQQRNPIADTVGQLPRTLESTRSGMVSLRTSLDKLTDTAGPLKQTAEELDPLFRHLKPVLAAARPVVTDLRDVLSDARPLVAELRPTVDEGNQVLEDVRGPVLERINGPILNALNTTWTGDGRYAGNSSPYKTYQDIAYTFTNVGASSKYTDRNGAALTIEIGYDPGAVQDVNGLPNSEALLRDLLGPKASPNEHR